MAEFAQYAQIASTVLSAAGPMMQGESKATSSEYQAAQMEAQARESMASAQREASEQRRQARLANSRLQAVAGGGGGDPTAVNLAADIAGEGEYRALGALYEGDTRAAGLRNQARALKAEAKNAKKAGMLGSITSIFSSAPKWGGK